MQAINVTQITSWVNGNCSSQFAHDVLIKQIVIDSRLASKNCLFIAIRGDNNDGHSFVANVLSEPTNFALVDNNFVSDLPNLIRVADTTKALGMIAKVYRQLFRIPVVAITGSNGKTTVKEMLLLVCNEEFSSEKVLATSGNFNNQWGMPLTLLNLESQHRVAILEMGMNHAGELDYLSRVAVPTIAVVNNVMFAHAGFFNSLADIALAKGEIYNGLNHEGIACVDISNPFSGKWLEILPTKNIFTYGTPDSSCYIKKQESVSAIYHTPLGEVTIKLKVLGEHNYLNALTVITVAVNLGCSLEAIKHGLESYAGYPGRLEQKTAFNGALLIDDSYNANPDSVKAALKAIQVLPKPYWFILGDLKELGANELEFHRQIGEAANLYQVELLLTVGNLAKHAANSFTGKKIHFETNQDIVEYCFLNLPSHATLLIKGSKSTQLAKVAKELTVPRHP